MEFVPVPKCSPEQVWAEAAKAGAPTGNLIGSVFFAADKDGKPRWHLTVPPNFSAFLPDSC
jgi:hypothetical protein